jgi:hypothetical protein
MEWANRILLAALTLAAPAVCQQTYVTRYDAFFGYAYLNSPAIKLPESGYQFQIGFRPSTRYSVGFDYSQAYGDLTLTPELLPDSLQQQLGTRLAQLAALGQLPPGYKLAVPARSKTQTFSLGPQLAFRRFKQVTFFVRPSMGAIHEVARPSPKDPIAQGIVAQLAPSGRKRDWTGFFGAGAGIDLNLSNHVSFRIQGDYVYDHLFNDILKDGRRTMRFGVGPCFNFGRNIAVPK